MEFTQPFECPACRQKSMIFPCDAHGIIYPHIIMNEKIGDKGLSIGAFEAVCQKCLHFILFNNGGLLHLEVIDNKVRIGHDK